MKVYKVKDVETGLYSWGPLKGHNVFMISFEVENQDIKIETEEDYQKLAEKTLEDFEKLISNKKLDEEYKNALYPPSRFDYYRFVLRGADLEQDVYARNQITCFFNQLSMASIRAYELSGSTYLHPIKIDAEINLHNTSVEDVYKYTPGSIKQLSYYRKFGVCLATIDGKILEKDPDEVYSLPALFEISHHGQSFFGLVPYNLKHLKLFEEKLFDNNLLNDVNPACIYLKLDELDEKDYSEALEWVKARHIRVDMPLKNMPKDAINKFI